MKKEALVLFLIMSSFFSYSQNIGIGTSTPDSSSALEIKSTSQGFLPPRMTLIQRNQIQNPAQGLMIYCTDCGIDGGVQIYKGTEWQSLVSTSLFAYSANQLKQGLIAHYPFNGNANDASQNANNGNVIGATLTTDRFGLLNRAFAFDGMDDYISVPNSNSLNQLNGDFTISFWATSDFMNIFQILQKGISLDSSNNLTSFRGNFFLSFTNNTADLLANGNYDPLSVLNPPFYWPFSDSSSWIHFAIIKRQSILTIFINGINIPIQNNGSDTYMSDSTYPLLIGRGVVTGYFYHKGKIDDIYIYNRALTYEEIYYLSTH
jgi:hypothetical protein